MMWIPPGRFWMGSPSGEKLWGDDNESPQHLVELQGFFLSQTPITQAQWREVAMWQPSDREQWGRELNTAPSHFQGKAAQLFEGETSTDQRPVDQVSWFDAAEFCNRLSQRTGRSYTLPSEAQWEYACRAGSTTPSHFGVTITPELANYGRGRTTPVGLFPANDWGLHDMYGNVWEWCTDHWFDNYTGAPSDGNPWLDPQALEGAERVMRGCCYGNGPQGFRSALRFHGQPGNVDIGLGFRVVCLPQSPLLSS
jgi:formylglycine-generating enzyme required for sulfatase activity